MPPAHRRLLTGTPEGAKTQDSAAGKQGQVVKPTEQPGQQPRQAVRRLLGEWRQPSSLLCLLSTQAGALTRREMAQGAEVDACKANAHHTQGFSSQPKVAQLAGLERR